MAPPLGTVVHGTKKKPPVWGIVGAVAAIAAVVVGVVVLTGGDDEKATTPAVVVTTTEAGQPDSSPNTTADSGQTATTAPTATTATLPSVATTAPAGGADGAVPGAPSGAKGTLDAPVPAGDIADIGGGWRLQVLDFTPDATALVAEENEFNDPPPAGYTFSIVRIALGYYGSDDPQSSFTPTISAVGAGNTELEGGCGLIPDEFPYFTDMFAGGVLVGNLCFVTTPADAGGMRLYAIGDWYTSDSEVFLDAAQPGAVAPMPALSGPQPGAAATAAREAPAPIGTAADVGGGWTVTVTGPARDITDEVLAGNQFNDPPPAGLRFIGVDVTYAYSGSEGTNAYEVTTKAVGNGNVELAWGCGVVPGELDSFSDVFAGGEVSGLLCFAAPAGESFVLYSTADYDVEPTFFATA